MHFSKQFPPERLAQHQFLWANFTQAYNAATLVDMSLEKSSS
jgi:hypothetical protein